MDSGNSLMTSVLATGTFNELSLVRVPFVHDVINNNTWLVWLASNCVVCQKCTTKILTRRFIAKYCSYYYICIAAPNSDTLSLCTLKTIQYCACDHGSLQTSAFESTTVAIRSPARLLFTSMHARLLSIKRKMMLIV